MIYNGEEVSQVEAGETVYFMLTETPFYAVSGGQVADTGIVYNDNFEIAVSEVTKAPNGQNLHKGVVQFGQVNVGATVSAEVNQNDRRDIQKNHSATHLLHAALKSVLGDHVNQAGSLVEADRLRFDFSHFGPMTNDEIDQVERLVNEEIWKVLTLTFKKWILLQLKKWAQWLYSVKNMVMLCV